MTTIIFSTILINLLLQSTQAQEIPKSVLESLIELQKFVSEPPEAEEQEEDASAYAVKEEMKKFLDSVMDSETEEEIVKDDLSAYYEAIEDGTKNYDSDFDYYNEFEPQTERPSLRTTPAYKTIIRNRQPTFENNEPTFKNSEPSIKNSEPSFKLKYDPVSGLFSTVRE